ncbi:MAG: hypothetical protein KKG76_13990 [Euryarchaeota archaeon]|nr:hypothetical protein [Euryarchaeota archaeon]
MKKQLEEGDFARLKEINESDNYDMLGSFIHRLSEIENSENLRGLEHFMRDLLDERSYLEFLINCGLIEKAGKTAARSFRKMFFIQLFRIMREYRFDAW